MKLLSYKSKKHTALVLFLTLLMVSCVTTPGVKFVKTIPKEQLIDANDSGVVTIEAAKDLQIEEDEKEWLSEHIENEIDVLKSDSAGATVEQLYELKVFLTRYESGAIFPHITATVSMLGLPARNKIAEFEISKPFLMAGQGDTFEDVKNDFAKSIAIAIIKGK